ncbi:hypothetical protein TNCV_4280041 [Trichonephila clavipes]|nr:hypothetical protein TNCV_4280041 [Trichonephila clavipes]
MYSAFAAWGYFKQPSSRKSLMKLVEGEERREPPDQPQRVLPQSWGETELNRPVTSMVLKVTGNDGRHLAFCHDEFLGP